MEFQNLQILLFLPVALFGSLILSGLQFDTPQKILRYTFSNFLQLVLYASILVMLIHFLTPVS